MKDIVASEYIEDTLGKYDTNSGELKWVSPLVNIATIINDNGETLDELLPNTSAEIREEINKMLEEVPKATQIIMDFRAILEENPDILQTLETIEQNKVDKVEGYGLSKNDFTDELITKLNSIENEANKIEVVNNLEETLSGKALDAYQGHLLSQSLDTVFQNVDSGKGLVANAIIDKGGSGVSNDSTFQELANGVSNIKSGGSGGEVDANLVNSSGEFGFNGDLIIPSEINGISVTSIRNYAFSNCIGLTSITLPNSLTSIGEGAFFSCIGLTSITLPNSLTSIGTYAFEDCEALESITIPNSVTRISYGTFTGCSSLTTAYVSNELNYTSGAFPSTTNVIEYTPGGADDPTIGGN